MFTDGQYDNIPSDTPTCLGSDTVVLRWVGDCPAFSGLRELRTLLQDLTVAVYQSQDLYLPSSG